MSRALISQTDFYFSPLIFSICYLRSYDSCYSKLILTKFVNPGVAKALNWVVDKKDARIIISNEIDGDEFEYKSKSNE